MKRTIKLTAAILAAVLLFIGIYYIYMNLSERYAPDSLISEETRTDDSSSESGQNDTENIENLAPDFTVIDISGNKVKLSDLHGKPIVLNFWASWCGYCKLEMPDFETMYKQYGDSVNFMMVNRTDGRKETVYTAKNYISENDYTFPIYFDTESEAAIAYSVSGIPVTYFIDADGKLIAHGNGMLDMESLEKGIKMITEDN